MANNVVSKIQLSGTTTYDIRDAALSAINGIVKCNGSGTLAAAAAGTDYQAPLAQNQTIWYGTCSTAAATREKDVSITGITTLEVGLQITVKFTNAQTYDGAPTLDLNSLGAKTIRHTSSGQTVRYEWVAGEVLNLVYDGTHWVIIDGGFANTQYYGVTKLNSSATSTSESYALTPKALNNFWLSCISPFPSYSTADAYDAGDHVRYDYHIYRCTAAIPSGTAWSVASSSVEAQPTFWEMIQDLSSDIGNKADLSNALKLNPTANQTVNIDNYDINFTNGSQYIKFCKDGGYLECGGKDGGLTIAASAYLEIVPGGELKITNTDQLKIGSTTTLNSLLASKAGIGDLAYTKSTLAAGTTAVLSNRVVHGFKPNNGASSLTCTLPDAVANRCRDFILDIDNSTNTSALGLEFSGLGTSFVLVSRDTSDVAEMTQIDAGVMARMYFTETALSSSSKPVIVIDRITFSDIVTT